MRILFAMKELSREAFFEMPGMAELLKDFKEHQIPWEYQDVKSDRILEAARRIDSGKWPLDRVKTEDRTRDALLVVTDSSELAKVLSERNICCVGFQRPWDTAFFTGASMVLNSFQDLDAEFFETIRRRFHGIPVEIGRTRRILVRESCPGDFEALFELSREAGNDRYTETMTSDEDDEREKFLAYIRQMYEYYGFGLWTVEEICSGAVIGRCGLFPVFDGENTEGRTEDPTEVRVELGYLIGQAYRGQGVALEACAVILEYAFTKLDLKEVYVSIQEENVASKKLASKLGFAFCETQPGAKGRNSQSELWKILRK